MGQEWGQCGTRATPPPACTPRRGLRNSSLLAPRPPLPKRPAESGLPAASQITAGGSALERKKFGDWLHRVQHQGLRPSLAAARSKRAALRYLPLPLGSGPGSRDWLRGALSQVLRGTDRVNCLRTQAAREDGGGAGEGDPRRPRGEPARASRVPLAGAEGFPCYRLLTFAPSAEHEGLAPPAAGSPASTLRSSGRPKWVGR